MSDDRNEDGEIQARRDKKIREAIVRPLFGDKQITETRISTDVCWHEYVTLVSGTMGEPKEVRCRTCKERLDPLLVLAKLARDWSHATYASKECKELEARVAELKHEETLIKGRLRGARKKIEDSRADIYFEELLRRISAAQTYAERYEIQRWQQSYAWLTTEQNAQLVEAWRLAERRFEDHQRQVKKQQKAGVRVIEGGKTE